jgi:hypothetical protein
MSGSMRLSNPRRVPARAHASVTTANSPSAVRRRRRWPSGVEAGGTSARGGPQWFSNAHRTSQRASWRSSSSKAMASAKSSSISTSSCERECSIGSISSTASRDGSNTSTKTSCSPNRAFSFSRSARPSSPRGVESSESSQLSTASSGAGTYQAGSAAIPCAGASMSKPPRPTCAGAAH